MLNLETLEVRCTPTAATVPPPSDVVIVAPVVASIIPVASTPVVANTSVVASIATVAVPSVVDTSVIDAVFTAAPPVVPPVLPMPREVPVVTLPMPREVLPTLAELIPLPSLEMCGPSFDPRPPIWLDFVPLPRSNDCPFLPPPIVPPVVVPPVIILPMPRELMP